MVLYDGIVDYVGVKVMMSCVTSRMIEICILVDASVGFFIFIFVLGGFGRWWIKGPLRK